MKNKKPFIFVLMPFSDDFQDVYRSGIKLACENAGVECARVDEQDFDETILQHIYDQIRTADAIVADMSGRNANVFYEVGYAHALKKRVILLTQSTGDIPFDLKHHSHIVYEGKLFLLREQLTKKLNFYFQPMKDSDTSVDSSAQVVRRLTRILAHVSATLGDQSSLEPLLNTVVNEVMQIFDAEVCSIYLNSPDSPNILTCVAGSGFAVGIVGIAKYEVGEGFTGSVFLNKRTHVISSLEELEKSLETRGNWMGKFDKMQWNPNSNYSSFRNVIATPLAIGDEPIGVIKVENKRAGTFTQDDIDILEAITSGILSLAIHNARLKSENMS
jgi:hypothetical protein